MYIQPSRRLLAIHTYKQGLVKWIWMQPDEVTKEQTRGAVQYFGLRALLEKTSLAETGS